MGNFPASAYRIFHLALPRKMTAECLVPPSVGESRCTINIVERFLEAGISNITRSIAGETQVTTGRTAFGLAAYATSRRRTLPSGAVVMSVPLNTLAEKTDSETGEITITQAAAWVQVIFPHEVEIEVGSHMLLTGKWAAGKQRGVAPDGTTLFWNDTLYVKEWAVTGKAEYQRLASERVAQAAVVEVEDIPMFAPPSGQSAEAKLAKALVAGEEPHAAVRSTRGKGRKAEDVLLDIEDI